MFIETRCLFNRAEKMECDEANSVMHTEVMLKFLREKRLEENFREVIIVSSCVYLGATSVLELLALTSKPKEWAAKIEPKGGQPKTTRAWLDGPQNVKKMTSTVNRQP